MHAGFILFTIKNGVMFIFILLYFEMYSLYSFILQITVMGLFPPKTTECRFTPREFSWMVSHFNYPLGFFHVFSACLYSWITLD